MDYLKSDLYALRCVQSLSDLGIHFSSASATEPHAHICHLFKHDKEE